MSMTMMRTNTIIAFFSVVFLNQSRPVLGGHRHARPHPDGHVSTSGGEVVGAYFLSTAEIPGGKKIFVHDRTASSFVFKSTSV